MEDSNTKIQDLERKLQELTQKVDALYSTAGFPDSVSEAIQNKGFVKIEKTLLTPYETQDERLSKYHYLFATIDGQKMVISAIDAKDFTVIKSINASTDTFTLSNHGFNNNETFIFWSTDTPPAGISNGQVVYIFNKSTNAFQLSATLLTPSAINITTVGTGLQYLQRLNITF